MAKGRKPAIDGLARPQGILDDVVYPIVQKAARKVANKTITGTSNKSYRVYQRALQMEDAVKARRLESYTRKAKKGTPQITKKYKDMKPADYYRVTTKGNRSAQQTLKADALGRGENVRKAAQRGRKTVRYRRNLPRI